jgi:hypothetical protein
MPYAGGMHRYAKLCAEIAERGYEGFVMRCRAVAAS